MEPVRDESFMQSFRCDSFHSVLWPPPSGATTESWDPAEAQNRSELSEQPRQPQQPGEAGGTLVQTLSIFTSPSTIRSHVRRLQEEKQIAAVEMKHLL